MVWPIMDKQVWTSELGIHLRRDDKSSQTTISVGLPLSGARLFRRAYGIKEAEKLLDPGDLERVVDALAHAYQRQISSTMLPRNIRSHECADARGIDVGNLAKVDDQCLRGVSPYDRLKIKHRRHHQRSVERENALSWLSSGLVFNAKGFLRHDGDINSHVILDC